MGDKAEYGKYRAPKMAVLMRTTMITATIGFMGALLSDKPPNMGRF